MNDKLTTARGRPRTFKEETITYNVVFPKDTLTELKEKAERLGLSSAGCVRDAVRMYLDGMEPSGTGEDYREGVADCLDQVRKSRKLNIAMATGKTMGEMVADEIERELLK